LEEENIDQLLETIEKPADERPMTTEPAPSPEQGAAPAPAQWNAKEWEFDWNGKKVAPDSVEKARTWMSQGYNYSQRMAEINRKERDFQTQAEKYKGYDRYDQINSYAKANPEWWKFVESQWASRSAFQPGAEAQPLDPRLEAMIAPLLEKVEALNQWKETAEQKATREAQEREDSALQADIDAIREQNPTIDFDAVDETGRTLEQRICAHGSEIGTKSFRAAFRDYLHDQLVESAKAQSIAAQAKPKTAAPPRGTTTTSTPRKAERSVQVKGKSYDDITKAVMDEYGIN
jgi:hypothetical protein